MGLCTQYSVPLFATVLIAVNTDSSSQNVLKCNLGLSQEAVARQFNRPTCKCHGATQCGR